MEIAVPKSVARRAHRPVRLGQEHVCAEALPADRGAVVRLLPRAGLRRRERPGGHERRLRGAALHRRQAAGGRAADRGRCHQRPAGGAQAAGRTGPGVPLPAGGHRVQPAGEALPGAQPRPGRPRLRPARHPPADVAAAPSPARPAARRLPARLRARDRQRKWRPPPSSACRCGTTGGTSTARSTSSATCTAAATNWRRCCGSWATSRASCPNDDPAWGRQDLSPSGRAARRSSWATWWTAGPRVLDTLQARAEHGRRPARPCACRATTT